ncbi:hypothetical protein HNP46_000009 [Pseudomonas nitritireducens]|uniref:ATPase AAA-type core domain-containing protein n=1 Tax=Pseudomonas nitroreducens TaxID=46680 RepID=A0A7W7KFL9_PSENT|nr:AAA family ATPase [Pseudomonas nitritireducens]MBB4861198.1 hypothetical protein [Pseudomonas nitritireducens]
MPAPTVSPATRNPKAMSLRQLLEEDDELPTNNRRQNKGLMENEQVAISPLGIEVQRALQELGVGSNQAVIFTRNLLEGMRFNEDDENLDHAPSVEAREKLKEMSEKQLNFCFKGTPFESADYDLLADMPIADIGPLAVDLVRLLTDCEFAHKAANIALSMRKTFLTVREVVENIAPIHAFYEEYALREKTNHSWKWTDSSMELYKELKQIVLLLPKSLKELYRGESELHADIDELLAEVTSRGLSLGHIHDYVSLRLSLENTCFYPSDNQGQWCVKLLKAFVAARDRVRPDGWANHRKEYMHFFSEAALGLALFPLLRSNKLTSLLIYWRDDVMAESIQAIFTCHYLETSFSRIEIRELFESKYDRFSCSERNEILESFHSSRGISAVSKALVPFKTFDLGNSAKNSEWLDDDGESTTVSTYRKLISPESLNKLDHLDELFPEFSSVTRKVRDRTVFSVKFGLHFKMQPLVIVGPPGLGKTLYLKELSKALDLPKLAIHAGQITCGSLLLGSQPTWSNTQPGLLVKELVKTKIANGIVAFDELSQLPHEVYRNGLSPLMALLSLLEADEARDYIDASTRTNFDLSWFSWIFTANDVLNLSPLLLSRLDVVHVDALKHYSAPSTIRNILELTLDRMELKGRIEVELDDLCCQVGLEFLNKKGQKRRIGKALEDAISAAALNTEPGAPVRITNSLFYEMLHPRRKDLTFG